MNYYDWKSNRQSCLRCRWTGLGSESELGETFADGAEYICPNCHEVLRFVAYPLLRESIRDPRAPASDKKFAAIALRRSTMTVQWEHEPAQSVGIAIIEIANFSARGMRRIYGRGDRFGSRAFNMDIFINRATRMLVRFWSRADEVASESWELFGLKPKTLPRACGEAGAEKPDEPERLIPVVLREKYDSWIIREL